MKIIYDRISEVIADNIKDIDSLFVFPNYVVKSSWIDWSINNPDSSKVRAFNLDQFMAWDEFRSSFLRAKDENLECIPPVIRKIFAEKIIASHKEKPFFNKILPCKDEYRENAFSLTNWMAGILPSLKLLKSRCVELSKDSGELEDYLKLFECYNKFLNDNNFYEPSYLDTDFKESGKKIFIFYPEVIMDFYEFKEVLSKAKDVTLIKLKAEDFVEKPDCIFFSDTRKELRYLALRLRKLQREGVDLRTVAINVADLENLRPYLERELSSYSIPFIVHAAIPYTKKGGGDIFLKIKEVASSSFSYESVRSFLLDRFIPWKDFEKNEQLVRKGKEMRCICNYEKIEKGDTKEEKDRKDIWYASLTYDTDDKKAKFYSMLKEHYLKLKEAILMFCNAKSFLALLNAWNSFRQKFLDEEQEGKQDNILGYIINELTFLVALEKKYLLKDSGKKIDYTPRSPLDFFIGETQEKTSYKPLKGYGVNIFQYRPAACADFDYQFVINSSQKSISVSFKELDFISDPENRNSLNLDENENEMNATKSFVCLYSLPQKEKERKVFFSAAKESLDGFSIVHTELNGIELEEESKEKEKESKRQSFLKEIKELDSFDFVTDEKKRFWSEEDLKKSEDKTEISRLQKEAFRSWKEIFEKNEESSISDILKQRVKIHLTEKGPEGFSKDKYKVSSTELKSFFNCPRLFLLEKVLQLSEDSLDVSLTKSNEIGTFVHKILELVIQEWKNKDGKIPILTQENSEEKRKEIKALIEKEFDEAEKIDRNFKKSKLAQRVIENQKGIIVNRVLDFLKEFCLEPDDKTKNKCFGGYKIVGLELEEEEPSVSSDFDFFGKIDCVLSPCDKEELIIVDFKTGSSPSILDSTVQEKNGVSLIKDFQVACYVKLLEKDEKKVSNALFYKIKKSDTDENPIVQVISEGTKKDRDAFDSTLTELEKYAEYFCDKCKKNDFDPIAFNSEDDERKKYGINIFKSCVKCKFNSVCRTSFNISKNELD